jgi:hypothetical protein
VEYRQVENSFVVRLIAAEGVPAANVPLGCPFDRTGGTVSAPGVTESHRYPGETPFSFPSASRGYMQTKVVPAGHTREYRILDAAGLNVAIDVM